MPQREQQCWGPASRAAAGQAAHPPHVAGLAVPLALLALGGLDRAGPGGAQQGRLLAAPLLLRRAGLALAQLPAEVLREAALQAPGQATPWERTADACGAPNALVQVQHAAEAQGAHRLGGLRGLRLAPGLPLRLLEVQRLLPVGVPDEVGLPAAAGPLADVCRLLEPVQGVPGGVCSAPLSGCCLGWPAAQAGAGRTHRRRLGQVGRGLARWVAARGLAAGGPGRCTGLLAGQQGGHPAGARCACPPALVSGSWQHGPGGHPPGVAPPRYGGPTGVLSRHWHAQEGAA